VRHLAGLRLEPDGGDLVLRRDEEVVERFYDAAEGAPHGWMEALRASGFALLIVGAHLGLRKPSAGNVQSAIRAGRALMGLVEFDEHP